MASPSLPPDPHQPELVRALCLVLVTVSAVAVMAIAVVSYSATACPTVAELPWAPTLER